MKQVQTTDPVGSATVYENIRLPIIVTIIFGAGLTFSNRHSVDVYKFCASSIGVGMLLEGMFVASVHLRFCSERSVCVYIILLT